MIADLPREARPLVIAGKTTLAAPRACSRRWCSAAGTSRRWRNPIATFSLISPSSARRSRCGFVPAPLPALLARLMLIHDYRRLILRDPMLPPALLPRDWIGREAFAAARSLYRALAKPAERWIDDHLQGRKRPAARARRGVQASLSLTPAGATRRLTARRNRRGASPCYIAEKGRPRNGDEASIACAGKPAEMVIVHTKTLQKIHTF